MKKNYKVSIKDNKVTGIVVPVHFFRLKKNGVVYAECPALRIVTYGRTLEKAKKMFQEAYSLWKETVNNREDAREVLENLGWRFSNKGVQPSYFSSYNVPIHLLGSDCLNLNISGPNNGRR